MTSPRGYDAGTAFLAVIPSFRGVQKAIEREVRGIERTLGKEGGKEFGKAFEEGTNDAVDRVLGTDTAKKSGKKAGDAYAGQFSTALKKAVGEAQREIRSTIKLVADDKEVQRTLRGVSNELNKIAKAKIGIDMDAAEALAKAEMIAKAIKGIQEQAERIDLGVNSAAAQRSIQQAAKAIRDLNDINVTIEPKIDDRQIGLFERAVKRRIKAALENIPPVKFDADVSPAQNKLQTLRHDLQTLSDKRVGIDINGAEALAELERIRAEMEAIKKDTDVDIQVRADAAGAVAELAAVRALVELVDGKAAKVEVEVKSDTAIGRLEAFRAKLLGVDHQGLEAANSFRSFNAVILAGAALLPGLVPILGAAAGGLALLGTQGLAAAAGLGTLIFAFGGVGDAVKALGEQQENGVRDAVASARTMRDAAASVEDAERAVARAREEGGRALEDAQRNLTEAQQRYSDALYDTGVTGSASAQAVQEAFAKLGPAGQVFAMYIDSLRDDMRGLRDEVQAGLFPGLQEAINDILVVNGPLLAEFMRNMGQALGDIARDFGDLMTSPQWQAIWATVNDYAPTFITQFADIGNALLTIFGELFVALAPYAERFGDSLVDMAEGASRWLEAWLESDQFENVMEWLFTNGPIIFEHIMSILKAAGALLVALEPLGEIILGIVGNIADFIAEMDPAVLGGIVTTILGLVVAFQLAHGAVALLTGATAIMQSALSKAVFLFGAAATALGILYTQSEPVREFFHWLVGIIGDVIEWFGELPGYIQAVVIGFGALALLRGPLGGVVTMVRDFTETMFLRMMYARDGVNGLGTAMGGLGGPASVAKRGLGGLTTFLGGPWAIAIGAAVIGLGALVDWLDTSSEAAERAEGYQKRLTDALRDSKGAIDDNVRALAAQELQDAEIGDSNALRVARELGLELPKVTEALLGNDEAYRSIRDSLNSIIDQSLLAENAGDMEWTENAEKARLLLEVLDALAPSMGLAREDAELLAGAQGELANQTGRVNTELAEEAAHLIALSESQIGYDQAVYNLAQAHQELADVLADENSTEEDIYRARQNIINQSQASYNAAARLAEARHQDASSADLQHWRNAAILADLVEQERLYGELPPRLAELKESLEGTVPAAFLAATEFENLGLSIKSVPDQKTIIVDSTTPEQIAALQTLGFTVEQLPDGTFKVTADTAEAEAALDALDVDRVINIVADVQWARAANRTDYGTNYGGGRAQGGPIYGPGGPTADVIPILASNGEYMIKAAAVKKYGVAFMDMINAGKYAMGGLIGGRQKYADGGLIANWGGTINLKGGDTNPLAMIWFDAIAAINAAAALGSAAVGQHFTNLRNHVLGTIRTLRADTLREWDPFMLRLVAGANTMKLATNQIVTELVLATLQNFATLRTGVDHVTGQTIAAISRQWSLLPLLMAVPVNTVIDRVLNRGLFAAFNNIVSELGLNKDWNIRPAVGITLSAQKLAAGGRVPGWSPNDRADNIPAMLTAGEWVQPVSAVDYYGADFMEAIRRRRIPREELALFGFGGPVQRRATGGQIFDLTRSVFPRAKLNSAYRPGDPGYHGRNMAADMGEAGFAGGIGRAYIAAMKRWWVDTYGRMANEIIYDGLGNDRPDIKNGRPLDYGASTRAAHRNHLHVAVAAALGAAVGGPLGGVLGGLVGAVAPAWYSKYGSPDGVLKRLEESVKAVDELAGMGKPGLIYGGLADKAVQFVWSKAEGAIEAMFAGIAGALQGAIAPASGASGPIVDIVRSVASKYGWGDGNEWNALSQLIQKESSWRPNAQNPSSTAYGLFQFLNGTWASTGIGKTSDPGLQTEAGLRYIKGRYGSPSQALAFHLQNNWYSEGGEVTSAGAPEEAPTLYDTGGWLPPGITTVLNATTKPEPILTSQQWAALTDRPAGNTMLDLKVFIGSREITDIVDIRLDERNELDERDRRSS